jgi:4-aminobutyrate aminotransferase-like enzyme
VLTYVDGDPLATIRPTDSPTLERLGAAAGEIDACLAGFDHSAMHRDMPWDLSRPEWISRHTHQITDPGRRGIVEQVLLQYRARVRPALALLPMSVIHNDLNDENILLSPHADGGWEMSGALDFGDMLWSHTVNELAILCAYTMLGSDAPLDVMSAIANGYHGTRPLSDHELLALFPLVCMRLCVSVTTSAIAAREDPDNAHRQITDAPAWELLERLQGVGWHHAEDALRRACGFTEHTRGAPKREETLERRRRVLGPSLSLAYEDPIEIVRGQGQFLYDSGGRAYLDCVNNVCHVGHSHPRVVAAMSEQAAVLNTNTRYLHPSIGEYAERLTATLPDSLEVCYFVNSGSEANELALRLARTHTGRHDVIVLDGAYHGNTSTLVDLSPYKCEGPGGAGLADWAHSVDKPDPYRGSHRGPGSGPAYAARVKEMCDRLATEGRPLAMFLAEPLLGCGGQVVPPDGYLRDAFEHVRAAGGVCVADEVQVGMGRAGKHYWVCEAMGVTPDIITVGKPIGNGHPLGAVVTTREIAASFDNGMEFFSTFGGNPVSVAVGMAVLDVIEHEGLRERAARVGGYLTDGFRALALRHDMIGDVRGMGMFMGVELVRSRDTLEPATEEAARVIEAVKTDRILLSTEGPFLNVLKIKPPLQFEETDADLLLGAVDRALTGL